MSKPYMCGDEINVYIPSGGCDCNYTLEEIESELNEHEYALMLNGSQVGVTVVVPRDEYIDSCVLRVVEYAEVPYAGAVVGDYYLDFAYKISMTHIYVPLSDITGGGYIVVDSLPEVGDSRYIYLVDDGGGNYDRYIWSEGDWVNIGGTNIDLSDYYTKTEIDDMISNIMLRFYPIGSIYMSANSTDPGSLFGGTWTRITDTFLLAAGSTYPADDGTHTTATAGEAAHKLVANELPKITGAFSIRRWGSSQTQGAMIHDTSGAFTNTYAGNTEAMAASTTINAQRQYVNMSFGNNQTHNNMPPYLTVYVWKRTA